MAVQSIAGHNSSDFWDGLFTEGRVYCKGPIYGHQLCPTQPILQETHWWINCCKLDITNKQHIKRDSFAFPLSPYSRRCSLLLTDKALLSTQQFKAVTAHCACVIPTLVILAVQGKVNVLIIKDICTNKWLDKNRKRLNIDTYRWICVMCSSLTSFLFSALFILNWLDVLFCLLVRMFAVICMLSTQVPRR